MLDWIEQHAPQTFERLSLLFLMGNRLRRVVYFSLVNQNDDEFNAIYHQNLRLIDLRRNHQLRIYRQMMDLYYEDVLILSGLSLYNGTRPATG